MDDFPATQALDDELENVSADDKQVFGYLTVEDEMYILQHGENRIGRDATKCSVVLKGQAVSAEHAVIKVSSQTDHYIWDLGSRNKTRMGQTVLEPNIRYHMDPTAKLMFANVHATYERKEFDNDISPSTIDWDESSEVDCSFAVPRNTKSDKVIEDSFQDISSIACSQDVVPGPFKLSFPNKQANVEEKDVNKSKKIVSEVQPTTEESQTSVTSPVLQNDSNEDIFDMPSQLEPEDKCVTAVKPNTFSERQLAAGHVQDNEDMDNVGSIYDLPTQCPEVDDMEKQQEMDDDVVDNIGSIYDLPTQCSEVDNMEKQQGTDDEAVDKENTIYDLPTQCPFVDEAETCPQNDVEEQDNIYDIPTQCPSEDVYNNDQPSSVGTEAVQNICSATNEKLLNDSLLSEDEHLFSNVHIDDEQSKEIKVNDSFSHEDDTDVNNTNSGNQLMLEGKSTLLKTPFVTSDCEDESENYANEVCEQVSNNDVPKKQNKQQDYCEAHEGDINENDTRHFYEKHDDELSKVKENSPKNQNKDQNPQTGQERRLSIEEQDHVLLKNTSTPVGAHNFKKSGCRAEFSQKNIISSDDIKKIHNEMQVDEHESEEDISNAPTQIIFQNEDSPCHVISDIEREPLGDNGDISDQTTLVIQDKSVYLVDINKRNENVDDISDAPTQVIWNKSVSDVIDVETNRVVSNEGSSQLNIQLRTVLDKADNYKKNEEENYEKENCSTEDYDISDLPTQVISRIEEDTQEIVKQKDDCVVIDKHISDLSMQVIQRNEKQSPRDIKYASIEEDISDLPTQVIRPPGKELHPCTNKGNKKQDVKYETTDENISDLSTQVLERPGRQSLQHSLQKTFNKKQSVDHAANDEDISDLPTQVIRKNEKQLTQDNKYTTIEEDVSDLPTQILEGSGRQSPQYNLQKLLNRNQNIHTVENIEDISDLPTQVIRRNGNQSPQDTKHTNIDEDISDLPTQILERSERQSPQYNLQELVLSKKQIIESDENIEDISDLPTQVIRRNDNQSPQDTKHANINEDISDLPTQILERSGRQSPQYNLQVLGPSKKQIIESDENVEDISDLPTQVIRRNDNQSPQDTKHANIDEDISHLPTQVIREGKTSGKKVSAFVLEVSREDDSGSETDPEDLFFKNTQKNKSESSNTIRDKRVGIGKEKKSENSNLSEKHLEYLASDIPIDISHVLSGDLAADAHSDDACSVNSDTLLQDLTEPCEMESSPNTMNCKESHIKNDKGASLSCVTVSSATDICNKPCTVTDDDIHNDPYQTKTTSQSSVSSQKPKRKVIDVVKKDSVSGELENSNLKKGNKLQISPPNSNKVNSAVENQTPQTLSQVYISVEKRMLLLHGTQSESNTEDTKDLDTSATDTIDLEEILVGRQSRLSNLSVEEVECLDDNQDTSIESLLPNTQEIESVARTIHSLVQPPAEEDSNDSEKFKLDDNTLNTHKNIRTRGRSKKEESKPKSKAQAAHSSFQHVENDNDSEIFKLDDNHSNTHTKNIRSRGRQKEEKDKASKSENDKKTTSLDKKLTSPKSNDNVPNKVQRNIRNKKENSDIQTDAVKEKENRPSRSRKMTWKLLDSFEVETSTSTPSNKNTPKSRKTLQKEEDEVKALEPESSHKLGHQVAKVKLQRMQNSTKDQEDMAKYQEQNDIIKEAEKLGTRKRATKKYENEVLNSEALPAETVRADSLCESTSKNDICDNNTAVEIKNRKNKKKTVHECVDKSDVNELVELSDSNDEPNVSKNSIKIEIIGKTRIGRKTAAEKRELAKDGESVDDDVSCSKFSVSENSKKDKTLKPKTGRKITNRGKSAETSELEKEIVLKNDIEVETVEKGAGRRITNMKESPRRSELSNVLESDTKDVSGKGKSGKKAVLKESPKTSEPAKEDEVIDLTDSYNVFIASENYPKDVTVKTRTGRKTTNIQELPKTSTVQESPKTSKSTRASKSVKDTADSSKIEKDIEKIESANTRTRRKTANVQESSTKVQSDNRKGKDTGKSVSKSEETKTIKSNEMPSGRKGRVLPQKNVLQNEEDSKNSKDENANDGKNNVKNKFQGKERGEADNDEQVTQTKRKFLDTNNTEISSNKRRKANVEERSSSSGKDNKMYNVQVRISPLKQEVKSSVSNVISRSAKVCGTSDVLVSAFNDSILSDSQTSFDSSMSDSQSMRGRPRKRTRTFEEAGSYASFAGKRQKTETIKEKHVGMSYSCASTSSNISESETEISKSGSTKQENIKHKVLFTGLKGDLSQLEARVKKLGGTVVEDPQICSVLVTDKIRRTVKFLCCAAQGKPIVPTDWLTKCGKEGRFLDPSNFLLKDKETEQKFKFSLAQTLKQASSKPLLNNYVVHVTTSVVPPRTEMKAIIESSGGTYLARAPASLPKESFIISCEEDKKLWTKFKKSGKPIVKAEILLAGILQHKLDFKEHQLV